MKWTGIIGALGVFVSLFMSGCSEKKTYQANWESMNNLPVPEWFEDAKFGIFVHWGVFTVR